MIFTFLIIISISFFLVKLLPNLPVEQFGKDMELILKRREALGYNKPLIEQYFIFIRKSLLGGDWGIGENMYRGSEVWAVFISKLPATMYVNILSMFVSVPLGLGLGIFAALKKNRWQDHVINIVVMLFISVPSYVYAFLVQYIFCFKLKWFPSQMNSGYNFFSWSMFLSVLPAVFSLSFGTIAGLTRYTRAELTEVLTSDFMLLARTKGLTKAQATTRHALRNAMVPIFPAILGEFIGIIGGSLIIENIFSVPGVGKLFIESITALDYNMFMLLSCFYCLIGLTSNIVIDLSYGFIDPRIRMGER
ncbi:MAG: ABC transporter permease, partial [Anaeroplasmataceae bacterium]|nr:ABC transporter permease [Anaeroplasmataceae bacterium]